VKRGYIILWRCIRDNHFWQDKPFDRSRAWIDLLMMANHTDGIIRSRGISVPVSRGQVGTSEVVMADKWGWSRGKVRRFLAELRKQGQIVQQNSNVNSLITITNYDLYQMVSTADDTANSTADGQQTVQQTDSKQYPKKECKRMERNEENENTSSYKMTINDFSFLYSDKFGSNMPGGCRNMASELCSQFSKDSIVQAFDTASVQGICTVAYVKGVLMGNGKQKQDIEEFDPTKDYPEGSFYYDYKKSMEV